MASASEKYGRLIKSNTLYSSVESSNGCEDATTGVRCKTKAEIRSSRRFKRESIADRNRNRFDVDLYDELSETLNQQKKLTRIIRAVDDEDLIEGEELEQDEEDEVVNNESRTNSSKSINTKNMNVSLKSSSSNVGPSPTLSSACSLSRANTIATSNRKKLLEEWRKKKEADEMRENSKRPLFKVCHVDSKDYVLPPTPQIHAPLPSSNFTFKVS